MKRVRIKTWLESRLNRKIFLSFLTVSLIPLCIVYCYINSAYSEKLRSDAFTQNQLTERNTAVLLEDYLTKIEYISNLFFDSDTQAMIRGASDSLSSYSARMALEKKVRVNLDLFKVMAYVDQVTFLKQDGTAMDVMNSLGYADTILFSVPPEEVGKRFKNQRLMRIEELNDSYTDKYVYLRQIDDLDLKNGTLGWLFIVFDRDQFDLLLQDLRTVLNTEIAMDDGELLLYDTMSGGPEAVNRLRAAAVSYSAPPKERKRAESISWDYRIENLGIRVTFFDDMKGVESNIRALSTMTGTVIFITVLIILAASLLFSETIVRPVTRLHKNLVRVKEGDYTVRVHVETRDEVGDLCDAFNGMAEEIDRLVNRVYSVELKEKEAAIKALQAQINPHFLYNTLDMIKSMAELYGALQVSEMIMALSKLFRYATHTDGVLVTIREELENLSSYMTIVGARFGGRIVFAARVPEELLAEPIVKVCLQPLVENSISHGLGRGRSGGRIAVTVKKEDGIMTVTVEDNGGGIQPERLAEIRGRLERRERVEEESGRGNVGLKNIHDRIRLYYGDAYGIVIDSFPGKGTVVTLSYPSDEIPAPEKIKEEPI
ncbi:sensor histidine kinase [Hungatella effluvii]|uniref:sensor histidine kinase n=1 Tax=Hungatella effluvii TaxID=1096246 RepID=UPI0022E41F72|nr:histidine kinase [Hungatella effluvii]